MRFHFRQPRRWQTVAEMSSGIYWDETDRCGHDWSDGRRFWHRVASSTSAMSGCADAPGAATVGPGNHSPGDGIVRRRRYGPAILTAGYRITVPGKLQPYLGAGVVYAIMLHNYDSAVSSLNVHDTFAYALQAGVEYAITQKWQAFVDVKQLWLSVNADGLLGGFIPVSAR